VNQLVKRLLVSNYVMPESQEQDIVHLTYSHKCLKCIPVSTAKL